MPLAFDSLSHGTIAFGFFNIHTHMLLLERLFFFADRFCDAVVELAEQGHASLETWRVPPGDVGNLHGAIAGVDHSGLIGATYARWPFPQLREQFHQHPDGERNEEAVRELVGEIGVPETVSLSASRDAVCLAELRFARRAFAELVDYVERGGFPRWLDERRPEYVQRMVRRLASDGWP